jgi:hypothetical protein
MRVPFMLRDMPGRVDVRITANTDPDAVGSSLLLDGSGSDFIEGFPVCRSTVIYPGEGYAAVFGWTQMVRSTDQSGEFEMDPLAIYADVATPFAWFGVKPQAFDAPSRELLYDMGWEAHCFLCISPDAVVTRRVQAICGFSWGFRVDAPQIHFAEPEPLASQAWDAHLELLRGSYPEWSFDRGYTEGGPGRA